MTERLARRRPQPRPSPATDAGPARRAASTTSSRPASGGSSRDNPIVGDVPRHPHRGPPARRRRRATPVLAELAAEQGPPRGDRGARPGRRCRRRARFERDLEIHNVRRAIFDTEVLRIWERRSTALDTSATRLFLLFARDFAPLAGAPRRRSPAGSRPSRRTSTQARTRADRARRSGSWQELEIETAARPARRSSTRSSTAGRRPARGRAAAPATRGRRRPEAAIEDYADWLEAIARRRRPTTGRSAASATTQLVALRAFDGLDADAILAIGEEQLASNKAARIAAAPRDRPDRRRGRGRRAHQGGPPGDVRGGARRLPRRDGPGAPAPHRPRHRRRSRPTSGSRSSRRPSTCATSSRSRPTSRRRSSTRTRRASTSSRRRSTTTRTRCASTTSARSATPASTRPTRATTSSWRSPRATRSLTRLLADAPEFVEGWGMYCEQMMREQGFDDGPELPPGACTPTRSGGPAGSSSTSGCTAASSASTRRPTSSSSTRASSDPNARAEVHRYTYTPTYQLSYLLGKVLLLGLRADEQRRLGDGVLAARLPRHAARQRLAADQLPPAGAPGAAARPTGP